MLLEQFFDPALDVDTNLDAATFAREEIERLQTAACRILVAIEIPRRLGGDATSDELALDKKRCKRTLHVLRQSLLGWAESPDVINHRPIREEDRVEGASMIWETWWADQQAHLTSRRAYVATWGLKKPDTAYAKRAVTRYTNELNHMAYAMR